MKSSQKQTPLEEAAALSKRLRILDGELALAQKDPGKFVAVHFAEERVRAVSYRTGAAVDVLLSQKQLTDAEAKAAAEVRKKRSPPSA